ncbi:MAG: response regulator transcription factor [Phycisphaerae bacterium]|nr:response regulator transcription factor [Phycisphaerae bacterium]
MRLSRRQEQIVLCLLQGRSDSQIATELGISVATVRTHLCRLFGKLGLQDRIELILHVFNHFLAGCREAGCHRI